MRTRFAVFTAVLLLALTACASTSDSGSGDPGTPDSGAGSPGAAAGTAADAVEGIWGNPDAEREPSLNLAADGRVTGTDGCNRLMGQWTFEDGKVVLSELAMTLMACPDVDQWLGSAATAVPADGTLRVYDGAGTEIGSLARPA